MFGILYGRTVRLCYEHLISFRLVLGVGSQIPDENVISGGFYIMMQQWNPQCPRVLHYDATMKPTVFPDLQCTILKWRAKSNPHSSESSGRGQVCSRVSCFLSWFILKIDLKSKWFPAHHVKFAACTTTQPLRYQTCSSDRQYTYSLLYLWNHRNVTRAFGVCRAEATMQLYRPLYGLLSVVNYDKLSRLRCSDEACSISRLGMN